MNYLKIRYQKTLSEDLIDEQYFFVFGSTGALGSLLTKYLVKKIIKFLQIKNLKKLKNKENLKYLNQIIKSHNLDYVINLIALTNVDLCEKKKKI